MSDPFQDYPAPIGAYAIDDTSDVRRVGEVVGQYDAMRRPHPCPSCQCPMAQGPFHGWWRIHVQGEERESLWWPPGVHVLGRIGPMAPADGAWEES